MESFSTYHKLQKEIEEYFIKNLEHNNSDIQQDSTITELNITKKKLAELSKYLEKKHSTKFNFSSKHYLHTVENITQSAFIMLQDSYD